MAIRNEHDAESTVEALEREWFSKADNSLSDISRFSYLPKGEKSKPWLMKMDLATINGIDSETWTIVDDKYVNRPDAISYKFYGNAKYWWIIAARNEINDPFRGFYKGRTLKIPDYQAVKNLLGISYE